MSEQTIDWGCSATIKQSTRQLSDRPISAPRPILSIPARPRRSGVSSRQKKSCLLPFRWWRAYVASW